MTIKCPTPQSSVALCLKQNKYFKCSNSEIGLMARIRGQLFYENMNNVYFNKNCFATLYITYLVSVYV